LKPERADAALPYVLFFWGWGWGWGVTNGTEYATKKKKGDKLTI